jgi:hypothetical protein
VTYILLVFFGLIGLLILLVPTQTLLSNDWGFVKIHYLISKNKDVGLVQARIYYNRLGKIFIAVSLAGLLIQSLFDFAIYA